MSNERDYDAEDAHSSEAFELQADVSRLTAEVTALRRENQAAYFKGAEDEMKRHFAEGGCKHAIAAVERERDGLREALERIEAVGCSGGAGIVAGQMAGIARRALSTPTGTRAGTAAAAEDQKAETPGSGTPPTEEGPTT